MLRILFLVLFCSGAQASYIQLEAGATQSIFNYFQLPNVDANRVNLPNESGTSFRATAFFNVTERGRLYFLYAPLTLKYSAMPQNNFEFNGQNFLANTPTEVTYKFNSYRIGYLWSFGLENLQFWIGPVAKIRDADLRVAQGTTAESFDNLGFVPLIGFGAEYFLNGWWSLYFHVDGLTASQGSAYDGVVESRFQIFESVAANVGYRILGGGADNDRLQNFAQFNSVTFSLLFGL